MVACHGTLNAAPLAHRNELLQGGSRSRKPLQSRSRDMSPKSGELMNLKVPAGSRTFYLDLKQDDDGGRYLSISEIDRRGKDRSRILIDESHLAKLHQAIGTVLERLNTKHKSKSYIVEEKRRDHRRAYEAWTTSEEIRLKDAYQSGATICDLADELGRAPTAVLSRLYQLGVISLHDRPRWD